MQTEPVNLVRRGTEQPYAVFGRAVANPADLFIYYLLFYPRWTVRIQNERLRKTVAVALLVSVTFNVTRLTKRVAQPINEIRNQSIEELK